jgi:hypothetical protein
MITSAVVIRILLELSVLLVGGIVAFIIAWELRQDRKIDKLELEQREVRELIKFVKEMSEHNFPDAWKEADKSKDLLIENLTRLCTDICAKNSK